METRVDPDKHRKAEFHFPEGTRDFGRLPLEFQGFCGYELTVNDTLLLPGVPDIGVLEHKGRFYAFSSKEAADNFASSPDKLVLICDPAGERGTEILFFQNCTHCKYVMIWPKISGMWH